MNQLDFSNIQLLDDESPMVLQPKHIKISLKNHQKASIYAMLEKEYNRRNRVLYYIGNKQRIFKMDLNIGILGDEVGKGKTLSTLGMISYDPFPPEHNPQRSVQRRLYTLLTKFPRDLTNLITEYMFNPKSVYLKFIYNEVKKDLIKTNLIVVPHNIFHQWKKDIETQTTFKLHSIRTVKDSMELDVLRKADIVLCNSNKYNKLTRMYQKYRWARVIFDEADSVNIPNNLPISANFLWFVTTTFRELPNHRNHGFIKSMFRNMRETISDKNFSVGLHGKNCDRSIYRRYDYEMYERLINHIVVKNCSKFVEKSFKLPDPVTKKVACITPLDVQIIKHAVDDTTLNMLNADNRDDAYERLGYASGANLVRSVLEILNNKIVANRQRNTNYGTRIEYIEDNPEIDHPTSASYFRKMIKTVEKKIKQDEKKIKEIKVNVEKFNFCISCQRHITYPAIETKCCQVKMCGECFSGKCSFCTKDIKKNATKKIKTGDAVESTKGKLSKLDTLNKIIDDETKEKRNRFLIFSDYNDSFNKIIKILKKKNIIYSELKGNSAVIGKRKRDFNDNKISILMLNSRFYGAGLNLQQTDNLIVYHKLDDATLEQVEGRAQRLGRRNNLHTYHLCYDHEL